MATVIRGSDNFDTSDNATQTELDALSTGKVLQVVQTTKNDTTSSSSGSFTDISGMSVSITPSSTSSKILVFYSVTIGGQTGMNNGLRLYRDSTSIAQGTGGISSNFEYTHFTRTAGNDLPRAYSMTVLDSPSTTSATTYKLQWRCEVGSTTIYLNRRYDTGNIVTFSTITAMEIAG